MDENGASATKEDFDEQKEKLTNVAHPITAKLYAGGEGSDADEPPKDHDEL